MLTRAVYNRTHAFLYAAILGVNAVDAGKGFSPLYIAINQPIVADIAFCPVLIGRVYVGPAVGSTLHSPLFLCKRFIVKTIGPIPHHNIVIVDRNPVVSVNMAAVRGSSTTDLAGS